MSDHSIISNAESDAFADRCFQLCSTIVGTFVEKWKDHFAARTGPAAAEKYVRGSVGLAFVTIAVSQLKPLGMTRDDVVQQVDEAWIDWVEPGGTKRPATETARQGLIDLPVTVDSRPCVILAIGAPEGTAAAKEGRHIHVRGETGTLWARAEDVAVGGGA